MVLNKLDKQNYLKNKLIGYRLTYEYDNLKEVSYTATSPKSLQTETSNTRMHGAHILVGPTIKDN